MPSIMITSSDIKRDFKKSTSKNRATNLNIFLFEQLKKTGKELSVFGTKRERGILIENPLKRLERASILNARQLRAGLKYQEMFELSNSSTHSRPNLESLGTSSCSTLSSGDCALDLRLEASKYIDDVKKVIAAKDLYFDKKTEKSHKYFIVLEAIFENQQSIRHLERVSGLNHSCIRRKVKEICEILTM
jgi:hypothetical protein